MPTTDLDQLMNRASLALAKMQYLEAEKLCDQALQIARDRKLWSYVARITLPILECRRQRRIIAAQGSVVLGTKQFSSDDLATLNQLPSGCVVFSGSDAQQQALKLTGHVHEQPRHLLVLFAQTGQTHWTVHSVHQPTLAVNFPAPPQAWQNRILTHENQEKMSSSDWPTPGDWVLDVMEKLGDQMLTTITAPTGQYQRVDALLKALHVVPDHEMLHQQLAQAASALI